MYEQYYRYDADNRLIQARGRGPEGEFEAEYHYDALGRRTRKTVSYKGKAPETTRFLWEGYRLLQEQRDNGTRRTWSYDPASTWTPLAALEQAGDGKQADVYWLHTDLNSAPLEVTDVEGNLRWSGNYDTFGKLQGQTAAGVEQRNGVVYDQPLRYAGQYQDKESGLHYNLFRYYEPEVGRFTTQDPIGLRGGLNLYQYAPNPLGWIDPLGLAFGSGKGTHNAKATLFDSNGNVKATGVWQSGNMTPDEAALGFPQSTLATHTEARITRELHPQASPGDRLVIDGEYPPCNSCKGKMNAFKTATGAEVEYKWPADHGDGTKVWNAKSKGTRKIPGADC